MLASHRETSESASATSMSFACVSVSVAGYLLAVPPHEAAMVAPSVGSIYAAESEAREAKRLRQ